MAFKDLRDFVTCLEGQGDCRKVSDEVDWNLEAGAITRRCCELGKPAPFFQKIKDYPPGYRILGDPVGTFRRLATAFGLPPEAPYGEILNVYDDRRKNPLKPTLVSTGPCKEVIQIGQEVDLFKLPAPLIHGGDGGRYIGAWHLVATKDLDSDWVNWGMYRIMIHDKNTVGVFIIPPQHIGKIFEKYERLNKPMPFAVVVGSEPIIPVVASSAVPYGMSEVDVVGGIRQEPLEVVRCETVDLVVPATAEIVLEGEVLPGVRRDEGPFGEYPGYQVSGAVPRPVGKIKAITFRRDPIIPFVCEGMPITGGHVACSISWASDLRSDLLRVGFPIKGICVSAEAALHLCVVSTETPYANIATQIAGCIWANKNGRHIPRVFVVNKDVDPADMIQVIHSFATKCDPVRGTTTIEHGIGSNLTPFIHPCDRESARCAKEVYDCTWPLDWPAEGVPIKASFQDLYPEGIKERVLKNWERYGL